MAKMMSMKAALAPLTEDEMDTSRELCIQGGFLEERFEEMQPEQTKAVAQTYRQLLQKNDGGRLGTLIGMPPGTGKTWVGVAIACMARAMTGIGPVAFAMPKNVMDDTKEIMKMLAPSLVQPVEP